MGVMDRREWLFTLHQQLRQFARVGLSRVLGTVPSTHGKYKFFVNLEECRLFYRAELNALGTILITKGVMTQQEWHKAMEDELARALEDQKKIWPEISVEEDGSGYTADIARLRKRMDDEGWPP